MSLSGISSSPYMLRYLHLNKPLWVSPGRRTSIATTAPVTTAVPDDRLDDRHFHVDVSWSGRTPEPLTTAV